MDHKWASIVGLIDHVVDPLSHEGSVDAVGGKSCISYVDLPQRVWNMILFRWTYMISKWHQLTMCTSTSMSVIRSCGTLQVIDGFQGQIAILGAWLGGSTPASIVILAQIQVKIPRSVLMR